MKPMELVAHDPLRYVGDMLAWTHSATVSEREALEILFISDGDEIAKGIQAGRESEPWNQYFENEASKFDGLKALNELVDRDVTGVARVLSQRIEQVIQSHEETIMAYKIANLLNFYKVTFSKLLGSDSALLDNLTALEDSAMRQFKALMRDNVASLQSESQHAPTDLGPPDFLQAGLKQLTAIMKTYDSSFASAEGREADFQPILAEAFDPYMSGSEGLSKDLDQPANDIYAINCLLAARTALAPFDFTSRRIKELQDMIGEHVTELVSYQYMFLRHTSGFNPLLEALAKVADPEDIASMKSLAQFQPQALMDASQTLDDFLPSALMDAMENLKYLQSSKLAREITEEAADQFCEGFETVEEKLLAMENLEVDQVEDGTGKPSLRALFPRTSGELRVLLS